MQFKKILLPVDGSEHAMHAARYAVGIARTQGAKLVLMHTYAPLPMLLAGEGREKAKEEMNMEANKVIDSYVALVEKEGVSYSKLVKEGDAGYSIVGAADEEGCDLIVMGSRGLSDVEGAFMGSVAHKVLAISNRPVLVMR